MMTDSRARNRKMILTALFSAIIIAMTFIPFVGYIQTPLFSITTLHLPVIIGAYLLGPSGAVTLGAVWGVTCFLNAFLINPIEGAIFLNPMISIVPRIIVGVLLALTGWLLSKVKMPVVLKLILFALVGTLSNTVLVLSAIGLFAGDSIIPFGETLQTIIQIVISANGIIEIALAVAITPVVLKGVTDFNGSRL